ncbi:MAG: fibronectin type III domain-containing protein [Acidiferrobacterales bacterium]
MPPTTNSDGSKLTDLAGYKIYYGTSKEYLQRVIDIEDPTVTEHTIDNLPPYTYYFVITAYNIAGAESSRSNIVTKTIE